MPVRVHRQIDYQGVRVELRVFGPRRAMLEEASQERHLDELPTLGPDPRETGLIFEILDSLLHRREMAFLDGLSQILVGETPGDRNALGCRKRGIMPGVSPLLP